MHPTGAGGRTMFIAYEIRNGHPALIHAPFCFSGSNYKGGKPVRLTMMIAVGRQARRQFGLRSAMLEWPPQAPASRLSMIVLPQHASLEYSF